MTSQAWELITTQHHCLRVRSVSEYEYILHNEQNMGSKQIQIQTMVRGLVHKLVLNSALQLGLGDISKHAYYHDLTIHNICQLNIVSIEI